jgi:inhibitor of cysteine peptidase
MLLSVGCGDAGPSPRQLTEADHGQTLELRSGERLEVALPGNPTTGYGWELAEVDTAVLRLVGEIAYRQEGEGLGAGGVFTATFEAASPGRTAVRLHYLRPWEREQAPERIFEVTVVVR